MGFCCLKCQSLIILIGGNQHQGRQFHEECIARCTTNQLYMADDTNDMNERQVDKQTLNHIIEGCFHITGSHRDLTNLDLGSPFLQPV